MGFGGLGFGVSGLGLVILTLAIRRIIANLMTIGNQIVNHNGNCSHHSSIHDNNKSSRSENHIIASAPKNKIICDCLHEGCKGVFVFGVDILTGMDALRPCMIL